MGLRWTAPDVNDLHSDFYNNDFYRNDLYHSDLYTTAIFTILCRHIQQDNPGGRRGGGDSLRRLWQSE